MRSPINFNLRGIDPNIMIILKKQAEKEQISVNVLILKCIERSLGFSRPIKKPVYDDLDHLAGTWKKEDAKVFEENTKFFEKIDKDMW